MFVSTEAPPKPDPVNPSMGLKDIGAQRISDPKGDIIPSLLHFARCPLGEREETKALRERNRLDPMEMDLSVFLVPMLRIDMDFMTFTSHPRTEVYEIPFGSPLTPGEVQDARCKSYLLLHLPNDIISS